MLRRLYGLHRLRMTIARKRRTSRIEINFRYFGFVLDNGALDPRYQFLHSSVSA